MVQLIMLVKNKTIIGLKFLIILQLHFQLLVKNKTIIGLKFSKHKPKPLTGEC